MDGLSITFDDGKKYGTQQVDNQTLIMNCGGTKAVCEG
jgi:hypothetical protein